MKKIILLIVAVLLINGVNAQTELWGMTSSGGQFGYGVIFKTNGDGTNQTIAKNFIIDYEGSDPLQTKLCKATNGKLYGMTKAGGLNGLGVLFEYDPVTHVYNKKMDFSGTVNGSKPNGSLIQASNGKLYGLTNLGGANGLGALIEYDLINNTCAVKYSFGGVNGSQPYGSLLRATNGKLYGMTPSGGANNNGVLFEYDFNTGIYTKKIDFNGTANGAGPYGGNLMQASNGNLYGMCSAGGTNNKGVLFEYDIITNNISKKIDFDGSNSGSDPRGSLIELNSKLYGMTTYGGLNNKGVLFDFDLVANVYLKHLDFSGVSDGAYPYGDLELSPSGKFYGMVQQGGANNVGALFEYDPITNIYLNHVDFDMINGAYPQGSLIIDSSGKFYGLTSEGGIYGGGVIFEYDPVTDNYYRKINLNGNNGRYPCGGLIKTTNGKLYGMTLGGGENNKGVIFEYDPILNVYVKKIDFDGVNGDSPQGSLFVADNGKLYGMTNYGGINNKGVLFEYDYVSNTYTKKIDFAGLTNGEKPFGNLMQANNGKLYGMARYGGTTNRGTLFEYDIIANSLVKKVDFTGANGQGPMGSLVQANNNKLYGMTEQGGTNIYGVLFEFDPATNIYAKKLDLGTASTGSSPTGNLINTSSGKLYGMTNGGGTSGVGVIFEYDVATNSFITKFNFSGTNGATPYGSLTEGYNGKLYGTTNQNNGNSSTLGTIFEYDPFLNVFNKRLDFNITNGKDPRYGSLLDRCTPPNAPLGAGNQSLCVGSTLSDLNASGLNVNWYASATSTVVISPTITLVNGNHYFASQTNGCESVNRLDVFVNLNALPTIGGIDGTVCVGDSYTFSPVGAISYSYSGGTNIVSPTSNTSYTISGTDANGCTNAAIGTITVNALPTYTLSALSGTNTCSNPGIGFSVNTSYSVLWSGPGAINPNATVPSVTVTSGGIYTVTVTDGLCSNSGTVAVISNTTAPLFTIMSNTLPICAGFSVSISANFTGTNSVSYLWDNSATTQSISVSPMLTSVYTATVTDNSNGCYSAQTATVNVNALPTLTIAGTNSVCIGSSTTLSVTNSGIAYFGWSNGSLLPITNVSPTVSTVYSVSTVDFNGCSDSQTVSVTVDNTCADVWPGDANSDGVADNLDVLELGLHFTQTGVPRAATSNNWQSYFANNWIGTITNGKNVNHSDCNGDGTINNDDTLAIYNNYGLTHTFKPAQTTTVNPQLNIVPDQAMVVKGMWGTASVYLGDASTPINNINGVAFTVDFDNTLIEPNSVYLEYQNSFIDASPNLYFRKLDFTNAKLFTATTHTVSNNVSGFGKIATLHYQIKSNLATDEVLTIGVSQANQSNASGIISPLTSGTGTLMAIGASVGIKESVMNDNILISPNPTDGLLNISFNSIPQNTKLEIYNMVGALVMTEILINKTNITNICDLSNGMYFVKVLENDKVVSVQKLVKL